MTNDRSIEADVLRCGYDIGYFDKSDIVRWADRQIAACNCPTTELMDLSMIRHRHPIDVIMLLRTIGSSDTTMAAQMQIGLICSLFEQSHLSAESAIRGLFSLINEPGLTSEQRSKFYYLDDGYGLALLGYNSLAEIERELREFAAPNAALFGQQCPGLIKSLKQ